MAALAEKAQITVDSLIADCGLTKKHWGLSTIRYAREPKLYNYVKRLQLLCSESIWLSLRPAC
jgi:hypothetical protein